MKNLLIACLVSILSACGGGGGGGEGSGAAASSSVVVVAPAPTPQCTGNPYYPMCAGTGVVYSVKMINAAHIDPHTNEVLIDSLSDKPNPRGNFLIQQYSTHTCPNLPDRTFFANEYQFNNTGKFIPPPVNPANTFWEEVTTVNGTPSIAETDGGYISQGEPIITMHPVAGEIIDSHSSLTTPDGQGCSTGVVTNPDFHTTYKTVRYVGDWNNWKHVWTATIVEWEGGNPKAPTYYQYWYTDADANGNESPTGGAGMVGLACHRPTGDDYFTCGNLYVAIYEGPTQ